MRILVVAPHPDDEAIGCGGFILRNLAVGNEVLTLFLTQGEHGMPGLDINTAASIRVEEAVIASEILGSTIYATWNEPDGGLTYSQDLMFRLKETIEAIKPDVVLVTHERESHPDHRAAGMLVREALSHIENPPEALTYEVWTPHVRVSRVMDITDVMDIKLSAIRAHQSQVVRTAFDTAAEGLNRYRGIMNGKCEYAEVFGKLHQSGAEEMKITLALLTWAPTVDHPRALYARRTLDAALNNIDPGDGNELRVHIADDGSDPQHVRELTEICRKYGYEPTITNSERGGYGKSYNLMMQACHDSSDYILPLEDDWELTRPLNLGPVVKAMDASSGTVRCVRMGYLGFTQQLKGTVVSFGGSLYLLLDPDSPEPHVFAGHPRLETVAFQRDVGSWPEGIAAGATEWEVTHRWPARTGVAWPLDLGVPASQDWGTLFAHIGAEGVGEVNPND